MGTGEIEDWTVSRYLDQLKDGDDAVFWIAGPDAGVYAIGRVVGEVWESHIDSESMGETYWLKPPSGQVWNCGLAMDRYFFEHPIRKAELAAEADFVDALILRIPWGGTPMPLTDRQFKAVLRRAGARPHRNVSEVDEGVEMERSLSTSPDSTEVANPPGTHLRTYSENHLVRDYEKFVGRRLVTKSFLRPGGLRLVADIWDEEEELLIEAKATASRENLRMALGQLADYSRFLKADHSCAVLVPERPPDDMVELLHSREILVIYRDGKGFSWE